MTRAARVQAPAEVPAPVTAVDWLLVALLCAVGVLAAGVELMLVPLFVGKVVCPVSVVAAIVTNLVLPRAGMSLVRRPLGAVLPLVSWLVPTLILTLYARPEGDILVSGGDAQEYVLYALLLLGAGAGFYAVIAASSAVAPPPPRTPPPTQRPANGPARGPAQGPARGPAQRRPTPGKR
ncbi:hypothetical protein [Jatrophihabitans sp.]|uniref:hypothetical protein n=1 Tax=Jatrophihabitans sp. TaxID=1932789 RepID=UPI0030C67E35|nr:conserved rane protein of unknown function [Jatrophihabitans sp.]